jgi:hypothetical protein
MLLIRFTNWLIGLRPFHSSDREAVEVHLPWLIAMSEPLYLGDVRLKPCLPTSPGVFINGAPLESDRDPPYLMEAKIAER